MTQSSSSARQLKLGALLSYLAIGINIISALIYSPWMLSKIGSDNYGLYTLAVSLINMFLLDFGISSAVSRFVSKYLAEGRQDKINQLLGVVYKLFFGIAALIGIVLFTLYFFIDKIYLSLTLAELAKFKVVYIISAVYSVLSLPLHITVSGVLNSYEKFIQNKLTDLAHKVVTVLLIALTLVLGYGLYTLVIITAAVNMATLLFKLLLIKIYTPVKTDLGFWDKGLLKEVFSFSVWVLINTICSRLIMNICPNILGITSGTLAITIFSFASALEGYSYTFASALDGMFMPKIARITYKEKSDEQILPLMTKVGRFQYHLIGLIFVGFTVVGKDFITMWLGKDYMTVYYCAVLLLLPAPFYLSQQIGKNTMVVTGKVKYLTYVNIAKAAVNIVLATVLSYFYGALGACVSICISYFVRNIASLYLYRKKLNLDVKKFCIDCYGKLSIPMILTLGLGLLLGSLSHNVSWIMLFIKAGLLLIIYELLVYFIALNRTEKNTIKNLLGRKRK